VVKNTVFRRACIQTDDMTIAMGVMEVQTATMAGAGFTALPTLASHPSLSSKVLVQAILTTTAGGSTRNASIVPDDGAAAPPPGSAANTGSSILPYTAPSSLSNATLTLPINVSSPAAFWIASGVAADAVAVGVFGYAHEVRRIACTA
jgi:hypothetical protein